MSLALSACRPPAAVRKRLSWRQMRWRRMAGIGEGYGDLERNLVKKQLLAIGFD
jgi:hypothetical protein